MFFRSSSLLYIFENYIFGIRLLFWRENLDFNCWTNLQLNNWQKKLSWFTHPHKSSLFWHHTMCLCEKQREDDVCLYWLTLLRFSVRAAGSHAHLQSGLSDRDRPGVSAQENIIFCDLKSDNILVWSLELEESVNVKLSDYGISRQSFHEGALGVEGTPGYQAPEIRPGIVYDEKVRPDPMSLIGCPSSFSVTAKVTVSIQAGFRFRGYMLSQDPVFKLPSWSYNASFHIHTRKWCAFGYMLSTDKMQEFPRRNYAVMHNKKIINDFYNTN